MYLGDIYETEESNIESNEMDINISEHNTDYDIGQSDFISGKELFQSVGESEILSKYGSDVGDDFSSEYIESIESKEAIQKNEISSIGSKIELQAISSNYPNVPLSELGFSSDLAFPTQCNNVVVGENFIFFFYNYKCTIRNGYLDADYVSYNNNYFVLYDSSFNRVNYGSDFSFTSGRSKYFGDIILSSVDLTGTTSFDANYDVTSGKILSEDVPDNPPIFEGDIIVDVNLDPVINSIDTLMLNQTIIIFLILFIWAEKKIRIAVNNFAGRERR